MRFMLFAMVAAGAALVGMGRVDGAELVATPRVLRPGDHGVGRRVTVPAWRDLEGREGRFSPPAKGLVVAMTSSTCPLSRKYLPVLARLAETYEPQGVRFLLVAANEPPVEPADASASRSAPMRDPLRELMATAAPGMVCVSEHAAALARIVGATTTTDVVLLDASGTVRYHGAVDDQYGLDYARDSARQRYLWDAIDALLAGKRPMVEATAAPGCVLEVQRNGASDGADVGSAKTATNAKLAAVTYHNRVSRILQRHCVECHRDGGLAPFALETLGQVTAHKAMIQQVVKQERMPPWFARDGHNSARWLNDRSLASADRDDLLAWLEGGLPAGNAGEAPLPLPAPGDWQIGKPDLVVKLPRPVAVKAEGTMPYQHLVVETGLTEDRWVEAFEISPSRREVVHHVLVFVIDGNGRRGGVEPSERSGFFAAYVPGNSSQVYPTGFAKKLPKGSRLLFQMHYTPNGQATEDQTRLALRFAKRPPLHIVETVGIANTRIQIPPRAADHAERATLRVPQDSVVLAFMPHMHLRGKAFRYEAKFRDGKTETLLDIPRYDFNWQLQYRLAQPWPVSAGTTLEVTGWYDNSVGNPANPDPDRTVRWGPQTFDEMLLGYIEYYVPGKPAPVDSLAGPEGASGPSGVTNSSGSSSGGAAGEAAGGGVTPAKLKNLGQRLAEVFRVVAVDPRFDKADTDRNGRMTLEEAQAAFGVVPRYANNAALLERHFRFLDADNDGSVTGEEFKRVAELGNR
jgi:thiol-disulfide isomerase/thioredoxin